MIEKKNTRYLQRISTGLAIAAMVVIIGALVVGIYRRRSDKLFNDRRCRRYFVGECGGTQKKKIAG